MESASIRLAAVALGIALSTSAPAERGKVIDEATGQPLEGVVVVATFTGSYFNPVHSNSGCYHVDVAVSNPQGEFEIDLLSGNFNLALTERRRNLRFFKAGYEDADSQSSLRGRYPVRLRSYIGTVSDRFDRHYFLTGASCEDAGARLLPLARAQHEEAARLATTLRERIIASLLLYEVEQRTLPIEAAYSRFEQRHRALTKGTEYEGALIIDPRMQSAPGRKAR